MQRPRHQVERIFARDRAEKLFVVTGAAGGRAQQFIDHRLRPLAFDHRQGDQRPIFRAQFRALLEEQIVIGWFRFARDRECINREATIRESVTRRIFRGASKLFAQVTKQLLGLRRRHRKFLVLRQSQSEPAIRTAPQRRFASARPVAQSAGARLHREQQIDAAVHGLGDFRIALCELRQSRAQIANGEPGQKARGGLFDAAVRIMKQLTQRFPDFGHARVRDIHVHLPGALQNLRIGNARQFRVVVLDPFRLHFAHKRRRIIHLDLRLQRVGQRRVLSGSKPDTPAPLPMSGRDELRGEIYRH